MPSNPSNFWAGPESDDPNSPGQSDTGNQAQKGPGGATPPQGWQPPAASKDPGADTAPQASAPPQAMGLGSGGQWGGGTGYISMADYINGNQDQITAERNSIGANAEKALGQATDAFHTSADAAAKGTTAAERAAMNDYYGFDTADAYRKEQDWMASKAAHPELAATGSADDPKTLMAGMPKLVDSNGNPLPAASGSNPYDLTQYKADFGDVKNRIGNTAEGADAAAKYDALGNEGAKMANLENWGGVFDAIRGQQGAGFDATLIGRGLAGEAAKGKVAQQQGKDYMDAAIKGAMGQNDQADYKGVDRYQAPPQAPQDMGPWIHQPGSDGTPDTWYQAGDPNAPKDTTTPTISTGNQTGVDAQGNPTYEQTPNPNYVPPEQDPNNPWTWGYGQQGGG